MARGDACSPSYSSSWPVPRRPPPAGQTQGGPSARTEGDTTPARPANREAGQEGSGRSRPINSEELPRLTLEEELRISSVTDPDLGFSQIGPVTVDQEGRIYVFDELDMEIRVHRSDGRLQRTLGRRGEGPGEFQGQLSLLGVRGDTVIALERRLPGLRMVLTLFSRDGAVLDSRPIDRLAIPLTPAWHAQIGYVSPRLLAPDGSLVSDTMMAFAAMNPHPDPGIADTVRVPRVRWNLAGEIIDTLEWKSFPPPGSRGSPASPLRLRVGDRHYPLPQPHPRDLPRIELFDGYLSLESAPPSGTDTASFQVIRTTFSGDTVYRQAFVYRPKEYHDSVLDALAWQVAWIPGRSARMTGAGTDPAVPPRRPEDSMAVWRALRNTMEFPRFQPPVRGSWVSGQGDLWLIREQESEATRWLLLDRHGRPRGHLELPPDTTPVWQEGDLLLAVHLDPFDIPWLIRYRIRE
jgi:hypothetical protein